MIPLQAEMKKTALVTGATGFVGSHLARRLVRDGWNVHVIIRPTSHLDQLFEARELIVCHEYDGSIDGLRQILEQVQPNVVFHLASLFVSEHQSSDIVPLIQNNLLFGTQLAEAMVETGFLSMVYAGTSWQHFQNENYKQQALKIADYYAGRHLDMEEPYWGGTLDATCEDMAQQGDGYYVVADAARRGPAVSPDAPADGRCVARSAA